MNGIRVKAVNIQLLRITQTEIRKGGTARKKNIAFKVSPIKMKSDGQIVEGIYLNNIQGFESDSVIQKGTRATEMGDGLFDHRPFA